MISGTKSGGLSVFKIKLIDTFRGEENKRLLFDEDLFISWIDFSGILDLNSINLIFTVLNFIIVQYAFESIDMSIVQKVYLKL